MAELCKKHAQSVGELEEKVDSLQKAKAKLEKDKASLSTVSSDLVGQLAEKDMEMEGLRSVWCEG